MPLYRIFKRCAPSYFKPAEVLIEHNVVVGATPAYRWALGLSHEQLARYLEPGNSLQKQHWRTKPSKAVLPHDVTVKR